jgi:polyketide synthase PksN
MPKDKNICIISSFGLSGTNCHTVLEKYKQENEIINQSPHKTLIFIITADSLFSMRKRIDDLIVYLIRDDSEDIGTICYSSYRKFSYGKYRMLIRISAKAELLTLLYLLKKSDITYTDESIYQNWNNKHKSCNEKINRFLAGENIYIDKEYQKLVRTIPLPLYPFEKKRCWVDYPVKEEKKIETYHLNWIKQNAKADEGKSENVVVLQVDTDDVMDQISRYCRTKGHNINVYKQDSNAIDSFVKAEKYINAIDLCSISTVIISHIKPQKYSSGNEIELNLINHIKILKTLINVTLEFKKQLRIVFISNNAFIVTGNEDKVIPESASFLMTGVSVCHEYPWIVCKSIDIECENLHLNNLYNEIFSNNDDLRVSIRADQRYVPVLYEDKFISTAHEEKRKIREGGTYLITGGLGTLGKLCTESIFEKQKNVTVVLVDRAVFPKESAWDQISQDDKHFTKISAYKDLKMKYKNVFHFTADISDEKAFQDVYKKIKNKIGHIHGIIHAAGVGVNMMGNPICDEDITVYQQVIAPKISGTINLINCIIKDKLDFIIFFSSDITLTGGKGSSHYIMANAYLNAVSETYRKENIYSLCWPRWLTDKNLIDERDMFFGITPGDGLKTLWTLLQQSPRTYYIGTLNKEHPYLKMTNMLPFTWTDNQINQKQTNMNGEYKPMKTNFILIDDDAEKYPNIKKNIAEVWARVLGVDTIQATEDLFSIGGNSYMITTIYDCINDLYPKIVKMSDLFIYTNIADLATFIGEKTEDNKTKEKI